MTRRNCPNWAEQWCSLLKVGYNRPSLPNFDTVSLADNLAGNKAGAQTSIKRYFGKFSIDNSPKIPKFPALLTAKHQ
jgi:hypothetical protein